MWLSSVIPSVIATVVVAAPGYPPLVERVLLGAKTGTSETRWTLSWLEGIDSGLSERYVTRTDGEDVWESNLGDHDGLHAAAFGPGFSPGFSAEDRERVQIPKEMAAGTQNRLFSQGRYWYLPVAERPLTGFSFASSDVIPWRPNRLGIAGLVPCWLSEHNENEFKIPERIAGKMDDATYTQSRSGVDVIITATFDTGQSTLEWVFDPRLDNLPVRATLNRNGVPIFWSETTYQRTGDRWTPKTAQFYRGDATQPYKAIEVDAASFDQPAHVRGFAPEDIGVLPGTQLGTATGMSVWTGGDLVDHEDYWPLVYQNPDLLHSKVAELLAETRQQSVEEYRDFLRRSGETWRAWYKRDHGFDPWEEEIDPKKSTDKDPWDEYVEKFLAENKLPDAGVTRAKEILKQAKSLRDARRKQNAAKIREAKREGDQRKLEKFEDIEKSIFDRMLVRNLKRLVPEKKPDPTTP